MSKHPIPFIRSAFNYDTAAASDESGLRCEDPSLAQQNMRDENDPNTIMAKYARTADQDFLNNALNAGSPQFGDFSSAVDYQTSQQRVRNADALFNGLSAQTRERFHNSPAEFLAFFEDDKNLPEAISLGLMKEGTTLPAGPLPHPHPKAKEGKVPAAPQGASDPD